MIQKVLKVGTSAAVTIPKKSLKEFGINIGDNIKIDFDKKNQAISIKPINVMSEKDTKIAKLGLNFINRYRKDLEALAQK